MRIYKKFILLAMSLITSISCGLSNRGREVALREWYATDVNRKLNVNNRNVITLVPDGRSKEILIHKWMYMDKGTVDSILSDDKMMKRYLKYKFDELVFTTGAPNTVWKAKKNGDRYTLYLEP